MREVRKHQRGFQSTYISRSAVGRFERLTLTSNKLGHLSTRNFRLDSLIELNQAFLPSILCVMIRAALAHIKYLFGERRDPSENNRHKINHSYSVLFNYILHASTLGDNSHLSARHLISITSLFVVRIIECISRGQHSTSNTVQTLPRPSSNIFVLAYNTLSTVPHSLCI